MTNATSAKGVALYVETSTDTWELFEEVSAVPEIGESSDKIDATSLLSDIKEYVKDIPDYSSDLEFTMNAIPTGTDGSNYDLIKGLDKDASHNWRIVYPQQGIQCELKGQFTWRMGSAEVSAIQTIVLTIIPQSAPVFSDYSTTATVSLDSNEVTA